jgi:hypothetical protein
MGENHYPPSLKPLFNESLSFSCGFPPLVPSAQEHRWVGSFFHSLSLCLHGLSDRRRSEASAINVFSIVFEFADGHC